MGGDADARASLQGSKESSRDTVDEPHAHPVNLATTAVARRGGSDLALDYGRTSSSAWPEVERVRVIGGGGGSCSHVCANHSVCVRGWSRWLSFKHIVKGPIIRLANDEYKLNSNIGP